MKKLAHLRQGIGAHTAEAFTRLELLAILFALGLLALVSIPVLANTKPRAERVTCANNLRLIGRACNMWASDHGDLNPWWVDYSEGGAQNHPFKNNAWFNFVVMSNELVTPLILACPRDDKARVASDFSTNPNGGFLNPSYKNNAVSYFIGLHGSCLTAPPSSPDLPVGSTALAGDRNLRFDDANVTCTSGIRTAVRIYFIRFRTWTDGLHGDTGNILGVDGQVKQTSNMRLQTAFGLPDPGNPGANTHLLMPR